jgi:hypothetical protein
MFSILVSDVHRFRDAMVEQNTAPKMINRRISSLSSIFKYLGGCAAECVLRFVCHLARSGRSTDSLPRTFDDGLPQAAQALLMGGIPAFVVLWLWHLTSDAFPSDISKGGRSEFRGHHTHFRAILGR